MTKHFAFMNDLKGLVGNEAFEPSGKHKPDLMKSLVHASDIGNPARPYELYKLWTLKILSEFF